MLAVFLFDKNGELFLTISMKYYLTHLYPKSMAIYGDYGNIIALRRRLTQIGFEVIVQNVEIGDSLPVQSDFYFIGGGADKDQYNVCQDLLSKSSRLKNDIEKGVCLFAICGGYQLLGKKFVGGDGTIIDGLDILPVFTKSLDTSVGSRSVGNIVVDCSIPELKGVKLVGFENHGGQTVFLNKNVKPLGKVLFGNGNNIDDNLEGCVYKNTIGCYLHGSCLPKNPKLRDYMIAKSLKAKSDFEGMDYSEKIIFPSVSDELATVVNKSLVTRFLKK